MQRWVLVMVSCTLVLSSLSAPSLAQDTPLSQLVVNLFRPENYSNAVGVGPNHTAHFQISGGTSGTEILFLNAALVNQAIITQLASLPLGSSSGGFTYSFNPEIGTFDRTSDSFGPSLAERALTNGRGKFNFGITFQSSEFDTFEGKDLDGGLDFFLLHNDCCKPPGNGIRTTPAFEGDLIRSNLSLDLRMRSLLFYFNYGIADRFDVAVVLPFNSVDISATNVASLQRLSTSINPNIHFFEGDDRDQVTFADSGSANGLGDLAVRAKWNFYRLTGGGLAAGFEYRAPTGDEQDLLGLGTWQTKFSFIASSDFNGFAPHFNLGYKLTGDPPSSLNDVEFPKLEGVDAPTNPSITREIPETLTLGQIDIAPDEFNYAVGFDWTVHPRATIAADIIGRRLIDAGRLREFPVEHTFRVEGNDGNVLADDGPVGTATFNQLFLDSVSVDQIFAAIGGKLNLGSTFLLSVNILFALTDEGLRDDVVPIIGFDYVF